MRRNRVTRTKTTCESPILRLFADSLAHTLRTLSHCSDAGYGEGNGKIAKEN